MFGVADLQRLRGDVDQQQRRGERCAVMEASARRVWAVAALGAQAY